MTAAINHAVKQAIPTHHHDLKVRHMDFEFSEEIPEFWYDNDPFKTLLLAALSGGFPEGERFFIDSVRNYQEQITDPELRQAIRAFIGQEAHHSKEHKILNDFLESRGYPISRIDKGVGAAMRMYRKHLSPARQLAHTAAVEHFTALMAEKYLLDADELAKMDPRMAGIWAWHAIEETEHKAVAFDVYKTAVNDEWVRISQMAICTVMFLGFSTYDFIDLMRHSGRQGDIKMWLKGVNYYWGTKGIFRKMIPDYLRYYRRSFHPWQHDSRAQVEAIKQRYLGDKA